MAHKTCDTFDSEHHRKKQKPQELLQFMYSKQEEESQCHMETPEKSPSLSEARPDSRR